MTEADELRAAIGEILRRPVGFTPVVDKQGRKWVTVNELYRIIEVQNEALRDALNIPRR